MADRVDSDQPRKRIAVACGRCRKRKIRCSGDPGNGGPCSNCKNAGYEPCLFLRVSSQETPLKDAADFSYNLDAARTYAHHSRGPVSPLSPIPQYAHELGAGGGDGLATYRQSAYPYSTGKGSYYPNMSGWASAYQDDGSVDYNLNYSPYPIINQETPLLSGYSAYATRKSVYVDPEASSYSYSNLTHRPATSSDGQGFSLSSMAASLPSPADRLHSNVNRTLTSSTSSFRNDGTPGAGAAVASYPTGKTSSSPATADVAYGNLQQQTGFEPAYSTNSGSSNSATLAIAAHRATAHADATYPTGAATTAGVGVATTDQLYGGGDSAIRPPTEDAGLSYVYSDSKLGGGGGGGGSGSGSRRDSQHSSSGGGGGGGVGAGSLLSNGHVYVPESHSAHPSAHHNAYVVPGPSITNTTTAAAAAATSSSSSLSLLSTHSNSSSSSSLSSSQGRGSSGLDGATTPVVDANGSTGLTRGGNCAASIISGNSSTVGGSSQQQHHHHQHLSDGHRRSAGSLRGG
ncbi:hypothetical protein GGR51DRAFT_574519 [Nemania sp. FL0031]|nr:hypothetical protein GGR51DRAFT_574519 [Nemania sp. FL0031]